MSRHDEQNMVYGVNAVLEALRAGKRQVESIAVLQSARPDRLKAVLDLAREKGVPVQRVPRHVRLSCLLRRHVVKQSRITCELAFVAVDCRHAETQFARAFAAPAA